MEINQPVSYYRVKSENLLVHNVQIYKGEEEIAKNIDSLEQSKKKYMYELYILSRTF